MATFRIPRVVLVTRPTDFEALVASHGTRDQAKFFLETRGQNIEEAEARQHRFDAAMKTVLDAIPVKWRRSRIDRADLPAFVFEPEDLVLALGQDGLVANVAKYLDGQAVFGVNPDPGAFEGVLVRHAPQAVGDLLADALAQRSKVEERTMVEATLDDGQRLVALNEVFVGHRSHQSARYRIRQGEREERHSSSGLIVSTGTGSTGWAKSIAWERKATVSLPRPTDPRLAFFVREAWPSRATGTKLCEGLVDGTHPLEVISEMNEDGILFGDGIEADRLEFTWGMRLRISLAAQRLRLVQA